MRRILLTAPLALIAATPAYATGGMTCRTAGQRPIEVSMTIGHVAGSPLVGATMRDGLRQVPVSPAQWWLDRSELRLILTDRQATRQEAIVRARRNGSVYDGSLWRGGQRRWVRCRES